MHLERILQSPGFQGSDSICKLLRRTIEKTLEGEQGSIKEYVLGAEVFGRGEQFDPSRDAIVRVQARKLREKLAAYYRGEGAREPVRIEFPKGHYVPVFRSAELRRRQTIAVLPFLNLSPAPNSSFFSDGLTEELMYVLSSMRDLSVMARTSAFQFKGSGADIREVGRYCIRS